MLDPVQPREFENGLFKCCFLLGGEKHSELGPIPPKLKTFRAICETVLFFKLVFQYDFKITTCKSKMTDELKTSAV